MTMDDETRDPHQYEYPSSTHERRGGILRELSDRQSDVRELLKDLRDESDQSFEGGLAGHLGYDDEIVLAAVLAAKENSAEPRGEVTHRDLIWAGAYLDYLDTMGFEIRRKRIKESVLYARRNN